MASAGKSDEHRSVASTPRSHLFPGALLRLEAGWSEEMLSEPFGLTIKFSDGAVSQAEFVLAADSEGAVVVDGYTTSAGTVIPEKTWSIAQHGAQGGLLNLRIGRQIFGE